jgi:protein-disulfide isomerase
MLNTSRILLGAAALLISLCGFNAVARAETSLVQVQNPTAVPSESKADSKLGPRLEDGDMVLGAANAPVTIIEYASLTCPHCAAFHTRTLPRLKAEYIDKGLVKYVYRDFPLDRIALQASMIARCAGPERYFGFLDVFFQQQSNWAAGNDPNKMIGALKRLARLGGMTEQQVDACLQNRQVQDSILAMSLAGEKQFQVNSTPTLIINGQRQAGALTIEEIEKIIKPLVGRS